jgi:hypothetical protein
MTDNVLVACWAFLAYHRITFRQRLVFGSMTLTVPKTRWSREKKEIAYQDIFTLFPQQVSGLQLLSFTHIGGTYTILAFMLPFDVVF